MKSASRFQRLELDLEKTYRRYRDGPETPQAGFLVSNKSKNLQLSFPPDGQVFLAASITKLLTSVILLKLEELGQLALSDSLDKYLLGAELGGLVVDNGEDKAHALTLSSLASNRSGVPNYYQLKVLDPSTDIAGVTSADPGWNFQEVLDLAKSLPNELARVSKKASYSFTNFQLLSEVIERITKRPLSELFQEFIFSPALMSDSFLLTKEHPTRFFEAASVLYQRQSYLGAARMASLRGEGALISTSRDLVKFMRSLEEGRLISKSSLASMREPTARLFPLVRYGLGTMKLTVPGPLLGRLRPAVLSGHLGATGAFAFHHLETQTYFAGSVNQLGDNTSGVKLLFEVVAKTLRAL